MSKLETITIDTPSGSSALQIGDGNTATIGLGKSGDTINIPAGATIANAGTATGFGGDNTPSFRAKNSSTQTFSSGYVKVQYDSEDWDTSSAFDTSNYRFTVPSGQAGKYHVTVTTRQDGTSAQALNYAIVIYKNGSGYRYINTNPSYGGNVERFAANYSETIDLAASDYLEIYINGGGFVLGAGSGLFMVHKLIGV